MSKKKQFHNAYDSNKTKLIHISEVPENSKDREDYSCIYCGDGLIAKKGKINEHHFAHKSGNDCEYESYLHKLAKLVFFQEFQNCLNQNKPFLIQWKDSPCKSAEEKSQLYHFRIDDYCECLSEERLLDLTLFYNQIKVENNEKINVDGFFPDILISNESNDFIFIEIAVSHSCDEEKIKSGHKILEIPIKTEEEIQEFKEHSLKSETIKIYNFEYKDFQKDRIEKYCTRCIIQNYENNLHKLAREVLYDEYQKCLKENKGFYIKEIIKEPCELAWLNHDDISMPSDCKCLEEKVTFEINLIDSFKEIQLIPLNMSSKNIKTPDLIFRGEQCSFSIKLIIKAKEDDFDVPETIRQEDNPSRLLKVYIQNLRDLNCFKSNTILFYENPYEQKYSDLRVENMDLWEDYKIEKYCNFCHVYQIHLSKNPICPVCNKNRYYIGNNATMCKECYERDLIQCSICNKRLHSKKFQKSCFICSKIEELKKIIISKINSNNVIRFDIIRRRRISRLSGEKYILQKLFYTSDTENLIEIESTLSQSFNNHRKRTRVDNCYWDGYNATFKEYIYLVLFSKKNQL